MNFESIGSEHLLYLLLWLVTPLALFAVHSRAKRLGGFLVYTYLFNTLVAHWFGALAYASPVARFIDPVDTIVGFRLSTWAILAFSLGVVIAPLGRRVVVQPSSEQFLLQRIQKLKDADRFVKLFFLPVGVLSWIATFSPISSIPSAGSILSAGKTCLVLATCVSCWSAWYQGDKARFHRWVAVSAIFPVITVVSAGFIGYGIGMVVSVLAFCAMFFRPRWLLLVALAGLLYGGVSLWVTYAQFRDELRANVWAGEGVDARLDVLSKVAFGFEGFDIMNQNHLNLVDLRLNQNDLVGAVVRHTPSSVPFRSGETILLGVASIVPRALWPSKPSTGGSGNYVSVHAMRAFGEGTSVGMGQVIEFYINFGTEGVLIGFFIFGLLLRWMDIRLVDALIRGDWVVVMFWFLVGSAFLQAGGSIAEITGSAVAGAVTALCGKMALRTLEKGRSNPRGGRSLSVGMR